jgi:hypothetical protein
METGAQILIRRCDTGWMSLECMCCHKVLWMGEESFWNFAKLTAMQMIDFFCRHQCRVP